MSPYANITHMELIAPTRPRLDHGLFDVGRQTHLLATYV
jgi:hypothetical protein